VIRLSVVVVNWNLRGQLHACLTSLARQSLRDLEVIVVDNGSTDGSAAMVRAEFPDVVVVPQPDNLGFAEGANRGIAASRGAWVATLNNDAVAEPDWAKALADAAEGAEPTCGMLQSLLLYSRRPGTINSTGIRVTARGYGRDRDEGRSAREPVAEDVFCPTAGAAAYRRVMLEAIRLPSGYFDRNHFLYYEDLDLGWRARLAGWTARYVPGSIVRHHWHASTDRIEPARLHEIAEINRLRTLVKNASLPFLVRTAPGSARSMAGLVRRGGRETLRRLGAALWESATARRWVSAMSVVGRTEIERAWVRRA